MGTEGTISSRMQLAGDVARIEIETKQLEREVNSANQSAIVAGIGVVIGVVLLIVFWPIGLLLIAAGVLGYLTQAARRGGAREKLRAAEAALIEARAKFAALAP